MRVLLPESLPTRRRSLGGTSLSVALHAVAIAGAVAATGLRAESPPREPPPKPLVYFKPPTDPAPRPTPPSTQPPPVAKPTLPQPPTVTIDHPLVENTRNLTVIPTTIPDPGTPLTGIGERSVAALLGTPSGDSTGTAASGNEPFTALTVEREVRLLSPAALRYPSMLRQAGIEGVVVLQYVVDTLGRAERESVRAVNGDGGANRMFVDAARDAVLQMRFAPAEAGGRRVRQLVEQRFAFELHR